MATGFCAISIHILSPLTLTYKIRGNKVWMEIAQINLLTQHPKHFLLEERNSKMRHQHAKHRWGI